MWAYSISQEICTRFLLCCGYTSTDFPIPTKLTSLALWQSNDCPSASKATLMNMDKYFMWIHYERLHNHNKAKHNKTVCIFSGIYCTSMPSRFDILPLGGKVKFVSTTDGIIMKKYYVLNWSMHKAVCVGYHSLRLVYNLACVKYMTGNEITIDKTCLTISNTYQALLWNAGLTFAV